VLNVPTALVTTILTRRPSTSVNNIIICYTYSLLNSPYTLILFWVQKAILIFVLKDFRDYPEFSVLYVKIGH
jgi:hypothetical protein